MVDCGRWTPFSRTGVPELWLRPSCADNSSPTVHTLYAASHDVRATNPPPTTRAQTALQWLTEEQPSEGKNKCIARYANALI